MDKLHLLVVRHIDLREGAVEPVGDERCRRARSSTSRCLNRVDDARLLIGDKVPELARASVKAREDLAVVRECHLLHRVPLVRVECSATRHLLRVEREPENNVFHLAGAETC